MKSFLLSLLLATAMCSAPSDRDKTVIVPSLKGLAFVSNVQSFQKSGVATFGISLAGVPLLKA